MHGALFLVSGPGFLRMASGTWILPTSWRIGGDSRVSASRLFMPSCLRNELTHKALNAPEMIAGVLVLGFAGDASM